MAQVSTAGPRHHVQFWEDASLLAEQISGFLNKALTAGGGAIAIARPLTLAVIELQLAKAGNDVVALQAAGRLALLDANDVLRVLLVDGVPTNENFDEHVATSVRATVARTAGPVHAYGEMVDILWSGGNRDAVVALETLWSELVAREPVTLLCGYQLRAFDRDVEGFELVCDHHDSVEPAQTPAPTIGNTSSRMLAQLEQRARALESEVAHRKRLEGRMHELLAVTGQLAGANDRDSVAQLTVEAGMRAVGAVDASLWLVAPGGTHLEMLAASKDGPTASGHYRVVPLTGDTPLAHAIRTGEPVFLGSLDDYAEQFPASRARLEQVRTAGQRAFAALPIVIHGQPLAGIVFTFDREREFSTTERAFKSILARQCALALARVQQQEQERALREAAERSAAAERDARSEIELLYDLIASVNQLDDPKAVYDIALHTVCRGARSDRAAILLFDSDGVLRFKAAHGLSDTYMRAVEGHSPWQHDTVGATPIAVHSVDDDLAWALYRDVFRAEGIGALAFIPVVHGRQLIGKFMLYRNDARRFELRDLQFASTVAVHVAQAVERKRSEVELARAYREERQAHLEAEEATRAREEILSVVSHDLRNPLSTILMGATSLLGVEGDRGAHRVRTIAERIHRQAERMARLIEDLVDFAGIQAGQLAIERKIHKPEEILSATNDIFSSMAQERGLRFEIRVMPNLPHIDCDSERAVQVMSNLVANALKVTPRGGAIAIGAEPKDSEVVFYVRDTGPGIAAEELPQLFERYWRSKHSQYKGAGLGLSIARGIIDAHGGRIWAESQLGRGSTFYFSFSSLRAN
ncbi:MAG TPA: ATP-binding protein [Kofleriaceae bacterium]